MTSGHVRRLLRTAAAVLAAAATALALAGCSTQPPQDEVAIHGLQAYFAGTSAQHRYLCAGVPANGHADGAPLPDRDVGVVSEQTTTWSGLGSAPVAAKKMLVTVTRGSQDQYLTVYVDTAHSCILQIVPSSDGAG